MKLFPSTPEEYQEYCEVMESMADHVESTIPDPHICPMSKKTRQSLVSAATRYDERQSKGKRYNPYALGQYFARIDDICADVANGADLRDAICAGFTGSLLNAMLKAANLQKPSDDEWTGRGKPLCYTPAK